VRIDGDSEWWNGSGPCSPGRGEGACPGSCGVGRETTGVGAEGGSNDGTSSSTVGGGGNEVWASGAPIGSGVLGLGSWPRLIAFKIRAAWNLANLIFC